MLKCMSYVYLNVPTKNKIINRIIYKIPVGIILMWRLIKFIFHTTVFFCFFFDLSIFLDFNFFLFSVNMNNIQIHWTTMWRKITNEPTCWYLQFALHIYLFSFFSMVYTLYTLHDSIWIYSLYNSFYRFVSLMFMLLLLPMMMNKWEKYSNHKRVQDVYEFILFSLHIFHFGHIVYLLALQIFDSYCCVYLILHWTIE